MEDSHKISNKLPIAGLIFLAVIVVAVLAMKQPELKYEISPEEMLEQALLYEDVIRPEALFEIQRSADSAYYQLIDLRSSHEFIKSHIEGSLNVPVHQLFDPEHRELFEQQKKINVLIAETHAEACGPWMLLKQLGHSNSVILIGGYDFYGQYMQNDFEPHGANYRDEKPLFEFEKVYEGNTGTPAQSTPAPPPPSAPAGNSNNKPPASGGC